MRIEPRQRRGAPACWRSSAWRRPKPSGEAPLRLAGRRATSEVAAPATRATTRSMREPGGALRPARRSTPRRPASGSSYLDGSTRATSTRYLQLGAHYLAQGEAEARRRRAEEGARDRARLVRAPTRAWARSTRGRHRPTQADPALPQGARARAAATCACALKLGDVLLPRAAARRRRWRRPTPCWRSIPTNRFALELKGRALRDLRRFDEAHGRGRPARWPRDPDDLRRAFLKVTVAEARRDFAGAAARARAAPARGRAPARTPSSGPATTASSSSTWASPTSSSTAIAEAADAFGAGARRGRRGRGGAARRSTWRRWCWPRTSTAALTEVRDGRTRFPDDARPGRRWRPTSCASRGKLDAGALARGRAAREVAAATWTSLVRGGRVLPARPSASPTRRRSLRQARARCEPQGPARALPARARCWSGRSATTTRRRSSARRSRVEPDSAPVLNYLGYMNADRGVRVAEALTLIERAVALDPENGAYLDSLGWALFRLDRARPRRRSSCAARSPRAAPTPSCSTTWATSCAAAATCARRSTTGAARSRARTTTRSWTAPRVERKIREAQAGLDDRRARPAAVGGPTPLAVRSRRRWRWRPLAAPALRRLRRRPPDVAARAAAARSYSGRLRVSLRGPQGRARAPRCCSPSARPDALRIEVPGPGGRAPDRGRARRPADRGVPGRARRRSRARATRRGLEALLGVALTPDAR